MEVNMNKVEIWMSVYGLMILIWFIKCMIDSDVCLGLGVWLGLTSVAIAIEEYAKASRRSENSR